jgi:hypothetical protein
MIQRSGEIFKDVNISIILHILVVRELFKVVKPFKMIISSDLKL